MGLLERRAEDNIPQVAAAHGMPGARIDGNDARAVYQAATEAVRRARGGDGPTLLECRTFRWRGHVGPSWDIDVGVQRKDELKDWLPRDPIPRLRNWLVERGCDAGELAAIDAAAGAEVTEAVEFARSSPFPRPDELTEHVFADQGTERR